MIATGVLYCGLAEGIIKSCVNYIYLQGQWYFSDVKYSNTIGLLRCSAQQAPIPKTFCPCWIFVYVVIDIVWQSNYGHISEFVPNGHCVVVENAGCGDPTRCGVISEYNQLILTSAILHEMDAFLNV